MKLRILSVFLVFLLAFSMIFGVAATETEETAVETTQETKPVRGEFECGDDLTWSYEDGVLTVKGSGEMDDYEEDAPWAAYKYDIEEVVLEGVTYIGARAFYNYDMLKSVDFGNKLKEIGTEAFRSCEGLKEIELPASFKIFGESSFLGCKNLEEIHCNGNFPSFRMNSMWECYATFYYPAENPWPLEHIEQLETAFHNRIEFLASDGSDPYNPTEATEETAEETTEETTEVTTEPPTEAPTESTVPVTEAPTEPATEASTEPATTAATEPSSEETVEETRAPATEEEKQMSNKVVMLGLGIALSLTMIAALLLVIRQTVKRGKYSK